MVVAITRNHDQSFADCEPPPVDHQLPATSHQKLITYYLLLLSRRLNKRDLVDLFQRSQSTLHSINCRLAKEMHSFVARRPPDFAAWPLGQDHLAHGIGQFQQLMNGGTSPEPRARALNAALAPAE